MTLRFQLRKRTLDTGETIFSPSIPVALIGKRQRIQYTAILDTGAEVCYLPPEIAEGIGVELQEKAYTAKSPESLFEYKLGKMGVTVSKAHEQYTIQGIPVMVPLEKKWVDVLLGIPFLSHFKTCFDYSEGIIEMKRTPRQYNLKTKKMGGFQY